MNKKDRLKLWAYGAAVVAVIAAMVAVSVAYAPKLLALIKDPDVFRDWVLGFGKLGVAVYVAMQVLQIVISVIPGEFVQIAGGYIYGTVGGTVLIMLGAAIGEAIVFYMTRAIGSPIIKLAVGKKNYDKFSFLINSDKTEAAMFLLFLIPGIPKDVLVYIAGVTPIKPGTFFALSLIGRFPAVMLSAYAGSHFQKGNYVSVAIMAVAAALLVGVGYFYKDKLMDLISKKTHKGGTDMDKMRAEAAHRRRRLIYNDDGDARRNKEACTDKASFLAERFEWVKDSQVDTYFWCVGNGMKPAYNTPDSENIGDADQIILDACREQKLEVFATLRMNDTHDSVFKNYLPPIKLERPDLLVAEDKNYPRDSILFLTWSAFDYAKEEVRKLRLEYIAEICEKYDWDGLELDFCRFRRYFRVGEEEMNAPIMTEFMGEVRKLLDGIAAKRGRPYLLAVRVPETVHYSNKLGLAVDKWIEKGLVDILIAGDGLKPYSFSLKELIDLGRSHDVPVYSCISLAQFEDDNTGDPRIAPRVRAAVSNRWLDEPDGIYIFNLCCSMNSRNRELASELRPLLDVLGDTETLRGTDKLYESEAIPHWADWQINNTPNIFPVRLIDDAPLPLVVADRIAAEGKEGKVEKLVLGVRVSNILDEENITVKFNGKPVELVRRYTVEGKKIGVFDHSGGTWFEADLDPAQVNRGENEVRAFVGTGSWGRISTLVQEVRLEVKYTL